MNYKNKWKPHSLNVEFWNEVLVDRTITRLIFDDDGVIAFELDDGQQVNLVGEKPTLMIEI